MRLQIHLLSKGNNKIPFFVVITLVRYCEVNYRLNDLKILALNYQSPVGMDKYIFSIAAANHIGSNNLA